MSNYIISGIQQVGIGVSNVHKGFNWYNEYFGMDVPIFEEAAEANLMLPYTGGKPHKRHAILAINLKGGGGFEIWQYTSRTPQAAKFKPQLGDLGLFCAKIKSASIQQSFDFLKAKGVTLLGDISTNPCNKKHFFMQDEFGNLFEIIEDDNMLVEEVNLCNKFEISYPNYLILKEFIVRECIQNGFIDRSHIKTSVMIDGREFDAVIDFLRNDMLYWINPITNNKIIYLEYSTVL